MALGGRYEQEYCPQSTAQSHKISHVSCDIVATLCAVTMEVLQNFHRDGKKKALGLYLEGDEASILRSISIPIPTSGKLCTPLAPLGPAAFLSGFSQEETPGSRLL